MTKIKSVSGRTPMGNYQDYEKSQGQRGRKTVSLETHTIENPASQRLTKNVEKRTVINQKGNIFKTKVRTGLAEGYVPNKILSRKTTRGIGVPAGITVKRK